MKVCGKLRTLGLTSEGTSRRCYTTRYSRGTIGYRAPEMLKEEASYNNKVDIWALGCILYEIACRKKAFASDYAVERLAFSEMSVQKPQIPKLPVSKRSQTCLSQLVDAMLDIQWWKRPSTSHLVMILRLLNNMPTGVAMNAMMEELNLLRPTGLSDENNIYWETMIWRSRWYFDHFSSISLTSDLVEPAFCLSQILFMFLLMLRSFLISIAASIIH